MFVLSQPIFRASHWGLRSAFSIASCTNFPMSSFILYSLGCEPLAQTLAADKRKGGTARFNCLFKLGRLRQEPLTINKHETIHT